MPHFETNNLTALVSRIQGRVRFLGCRTDRERQRCTAAGHGQPARPSSGISCVSSACDSACHGAGAHQTSLKRNTQPQKTAQTGQRGAHARACTRTLADGAHVRAHTNMYTHTHPGQLLPWTRPGPGSLLSAPSRPPGCPGGPQTPLETVRSQPSCPSPSRAPGQGLALRGPGSLDCQGERHTPLADSGR